MKQGMAPSEQPPLAQSAVRNRLLASLSLSDWTTLSAMLEMVELRKHRILNHANFPIEHVYFPETALISVLAKIASRWVGVWLVGSEGMTGAPVILGASEQPFQHHV